MHVKEKVNLDCTLEEFSTLFCDIFNHLPESFEIVETLKQKHHRLMLLSNTNELHYEYLAERSSLESLFDEIILSYKVNCQKPHRQIYEILIEKADCDPREILFIDDLAENIEGAKELGIEGHQFTSVNKLRNELRERNLL